MFLIFFVVVDVVHNYSLVTGQRQALTIGQSTPFSLD